MISFLMAITLLEKKRNLNKYNHFLTLLGISRRDIINIARLVRTKIAYQSKY
jgi:hypothetical protein